MILGDTLLLVFDFDCLLFCVGRCVLAELGRLGGAYSGTLSAARNLMPARLELLCFGIGEMWYDEWMK